MPKRLAITGPYQVAVIDYDEPALEANQVRVKTEIASGKHGTTFGGFEGGAFGGQNFLTDMRLFVPKSEEEKREDEKKRSEPRRPGGTGTSGVGTITEIGSGVTKWKVGDRVFGHMDVRETNVCSEDGLFELGSINPKAALCIEPAYVSIHCIREGNVRYGDNVAIFGLGAIGLVAVQMARASGADKVFAIDMLANRRKVAKELGADDAFDPREIDAPLEIHKRTDGRGADVSIEVSGATPALNDALRAARICGTVVSAGFYQTEGKGLWLGREWHHNRLNIVVPHGCGWGHEPRDFPGWTRSRGQEALATQLRNGILNTPQIIDPVIPIEKGPEVFQLIKDDPGKVIKFAVKF